MDFKCSECDERSYHWHCRYCERFLSQPVKQCPHCGVPEPTVEREAAYPPGMAPNQRDLICPAGCPPRGAKQFKVGGVSTTLVGFSGGPKNDGNHWTAGFDCKDCGGHFCKEWIVRSGVVAYVDEERRVLIGEPLSCCRSSYQVRCECGAWRKHAWALSGKKWITLAEPEFWRCGGCGKETSC